MRRLSILAVLLGLLVTVVPSWPVAANQTFRLSIGAGHPDTSAWIASVRDFFAPEVARRVKERTGHTIEWVHAYGGTVCRLGECLHAIRDGLLDVGDLQVPFNPSELMAHNFSYFVPFGAGDPRVAAEAARRVYEAHPELKEILERRYNQIFLGVGVVGNYGLVTNFAWNDPSELNGRKIAAAGPNIPWVTSVGVVPVQSNLNEAYTAIQTGVYDGWVMFPDGVASFRLHEVAPYYTVIDFGSISTVVLTINRNTWNRLPQEVREIMLEVGREFSAAESQAIWEATQAAFDTIRAAGGSVRELTQEEKVRWANALPNIPRERMQEIAAAGLPAEPVRTYIQFLKEAGVDLPRDWSQELD